MRRANRHSLLKNFSLLNSNVPVLKAFPCIVFALSCKRWTYQKWSQKRFLNLLLLNISKNTANEDSRIDAVSPPHPVSFSNVADNPFQPRNNHRNHSRCSFSILLPIRPKPAPVPSRWRIPKLREKDRLLHQRIYLPPLKHEHVQHPQRQCRRHHRHSSLHRHLLPTQP